MQNKIANQLKTIPLFQEEIGVINGCLLGDGTLSKSGKYYHRLRIEHSLSQSEYVWWKYSLLKRITISSPKEVGSHRSLRFGTVGHPDISTLRNLWYVKGTKRIPDFEITDLSIAIWFMDDGCKHRDTVDFSVHNYKTCDISKLQAALGARGIETTINSDGKGSRLYVKKGSYPAFKRLVKPYILKSMAYKLP